MKAWLGGGQTRVWGRGGKVHLTSQGRLNAAVRIGGGGGEGGGAWWGGCLFGAMGRLDSAGLEGRGSSH